MIKEKYYIIPESYLKKLEEARCKLYNLLPNEDTYDLTRLMDCTDIMWKISHRKWEEYKK